MEDPVDLPFSALARPYPMKPIIEVLLIALSIYRWIMIAMIIFSWLNAFGVINSRNQVVYMIGDFLHRATEPVLAPIRRFIPSFNGLDLSPLVAFLIIYLLERYLSGYVYFWVP